MGKTHVKIYNCIYPLSRFVKYIIYNLACFAIIFIGDVIMWLTVIWLFIFILFSAEFCLNLFLLIMCWKGPEVYRTKNNVQGCLRYQLIICGMLWLAISVGTLI